MRLSRTRLGLLGLALLLQWLVPLSLIVGREQVIRNGTEVRMVVVPIDPSDPFRGRYVRINPQPEGSGEVVLPAGLKRGQTAYAVLTTDERGYARLERIVEARPESGLSLKGLVRSPGSSTLDFGLDRYYLNEKLAPAAEALLRDRLQTESEVAVTIRLYKGRGVITGLTVDDQPVETVLARSP